jgi:hypothetical protein
MPPIPPRFGTLHLIVGPQQPIFTRHLRGRSAHLRTPVRTPTRRMRALRMPVALALAKAGIEKRSDAAAHFPNSDFCCWFRRFARAAPWKIRRAAPTRSSSHRPRSRHPTRNEKTAAGRPVAGVLLLKAVSGSGTRQIESSFPRKRESRATALPLALDPRFRGGDVFGSISLQQRCTSATARLRAAASLPNQYRMCSATGLSSAPTVKAACWKVGFDSTARTPFDSA